MTRPIKPNEVAAVATVAIPAVVFETVNLLIARNFSHDSAVVKQKEIVSNLVSKGLFEREIFDNGYLNIEESYKAAGWNVYYDKPGYNESYDATFTFRVQK
jgi:hypothetical protein